MSLVAVPMMLAPILGPTLGGVLIQTLGWRWIFFVNLPVCIVAVVAGGADPAELRGLEDRPAGRTGPGSDVERPRGDHLRSGGDRHARHLRLRRGCTCRSPPASCWWRRSPWHATHAKNPLLDLNLYRRWNFTAASIAMFALGAAVFGAMILMPLYWQQLRHESVIDTGLLTAPQGLGMALVMPLAGKLTERFGGGPIALAGVLVTTVIDRSPSA